jgi:hypothetical protein
MGNNNYRTQQLRDSAIALDPETWVFYLRVPRSHVVLLQTYFELYDGVGTVRTVAEPEPTLCVMTTAGLKEDCIAVLEAISEDVEWEIAPRPLDPLDKANLTDASTDKS